MNIIKCIKKNKMFLSKIHKYPNNNPKNIKNNYNLIINNLSFLKTKLTNNRINKICKIIHLINLFILNNNSNTMNNKYNLLKNSSNNKYNNNKIFKRILIFLN